MNETQMNELRKAGHSNRPPVKEKASVTVP